jgi:hypothetical protein
MYIKWKRGHPYIYESQRVDGKVVSRYVTRATPELAALMRADQKSRAEQAEASRALRGKERELQKRQDEVWKGLQEQLRRAMESAGYHNPKARGWRKRRVAKGGVR